MKIPKNIKIGNVIKLSFLDAFGRGSWNGVDDVNRGFKEHIIAEIVGYYLKSDENFIVLSMGTQNDPASKPFLHLEFIPKGAVIKIKKIG